MSDHPPPTKARIWVESISPSACRSCGKPATWAQFCKSGKKMLFDRLEVVNEGLDEETGKAFQTVSLKHSHFATCPDAKNWKGKGTSSAAPPMTGFGQIAGAIAELRQAQTALRKLYAESDLEHKVTVVTVGQAVTRAINILEK